MALLTTVKNENTRHLDFLFPNWRAWIREMLWEELEKLEHLDPEQPIYTFSERVKVWKLPPIPIAFTFRVKHLRWVAGFLIGDKP